ncbi:MAG: T9SS type A sorting domain-containing protein, partial [Flavobacteriales bacterium]
MRKLYALALTLFVAAGMTAQSWQNVSFQSFDKKDMSPIITKKGEGTAAAMLKNTDILFEDFEEGIPALPEGWTGTDVTNLDGETVPAFITGDAAQANNGGYWPVPDVPVGNNFALANDDGPPCDCDMFLVQLTAPEVDLSTATNPALSFDIFHDQGFGGGDAGVEVSTDGGENWTVLTEALPVDAVVWQTIILPLYDYEGETSLTVRFFWSDAGSWASGFAVDNVGIGSLADNNIAADKVEFGDWNQEEFGAGVYPFTQVPVAQVSPVAATAVLSNFGFNDQANASFELEVLFDGTSQGTWTSEVSPEILTLTKDTLSIVTDYTPSATGEVTITATVTSETGDDVMADNMVENSMMITDFTYARDGNSAEAFNGDGSSSEYGNLFDIYADQMCGGIDVCVGAGSEIGAIFYCQIYEFEGLDEEGLPILEYITETLEHTVEEADLTSVLEANWLTLPFDFDNGGAQMLEAGKTYLAVLVNFGGTDAIRVPVSGVNEWVASWLFSDGEWGATFSVPMVRLNMDASISVNDIADAEAVVGQNVPNPAVNMTTINYSLVQSSTVSLEVFDAAGKLVISQDYGTRAAGEHNIVLDVAALPAGLYNYSVIVNGAPVTK